MQTKEAIVIGVAITPTVTTVATSDLAGRVVEQKEFLTDPDAAKTLKAVITLFKEFSVRNKGSIETVGVSFPGLVDPPAGNNFYILYLTRRNIPAFVQY